MTSPLEGEVATSEALWRVGGQRFPINPSRSQSASWPNFFTS